LELGMLRACIGQVHLVAAKEIARYL